MFKDDFVGSFGTVLVSVRKTVLDHIFKHPQVRQKYFTCIFNSLLVA